MIKFRETSLDENELFEKARNSFLRAVKNLVKEDKEAYQSLFGENSIDSLNLALARISYSKNFEIEDLFYFDKSSSFHIYILLYVFVCDDDGDKESLCGYTLMLDEALCIVDDFFG